MRIRSTLPIAIALALSAAPTLALAGPPNTCRPVLDVAMTCIGTDRDEWLTTGDGNDTLDGRGGDDRLKARLYGQAGRDVILGDEAGSGGADLVSGGSGSDRVFGMAGTDDVRGDSGNDVVHGGNGR